MYTLVFPFSIPTTMDISFEDLSISNDSLDISCTKKGDEYIIKVEGFENKVDAENYVSKIWAGLKWCTLNKALPSSSVLDVQKLEYAEDAVEAAKNVNKNFGTKYKKVDGIIDGHRPAIYESDKYVLNITASSPSVIKKLSGQDILDCIQEGIDFPNSDRIQSQDRLIIAIDLYGAHHTESSDNARFLTLIMALEALTEPEQRPEFIRELINQWISQLKQLKEELSSNEDKVHILDSLEREIAFRNENSIRSQIRKLVLNALSINGDEDATETAKEAVRLYDLRSKLVHDGCLESQILRRATRDSKSIVKRVLKIKFLQVAR